MKKHQKALLVAATLVVSTFTFSGFGTGAAYAATPAAVLQAESQMKQSSISELTNDTLVFKVDPRIEAKNVRFQNRYCFDVAGHLYLPKNFNAQKHIRPSSFQGLSALSKNNLPAYMPRKWRNTDMSLSPLIRP